MDYTLNASEARVLGCLMEKEKATPEYYPLSLNALVNACNQKSNRDPVVSYDEETVIAALEALMARKMVRQSNVGRVTKFEQTFSHGLNLVAREEAVLTLLLLRGPQTSGELRGRSERLHAFADLAEVHEALASLAESGLVRRLARQPGRKEPRYAHLLSGEPAEAEAAAPAGAAAASDSGRLEELAALVEALRQEVGDLRREVERLKPAQD